MPRARVVAPALALAVLAACGPSQGGGGGAPSPAEPTTMTQLFNLPAYFQSLGRLASGRPIPFVGSVAVFPGPADSAIALVGLSFESRALSFVREGQVFVAKYRVDVTFTREGAAPVTAGRDEVVRVGSYQETTRADEAILFQLPLTLAPGDYAVNVTVRDASSFTTATAASQVRIPAFTPGTLTAPVLVYRAEGRARATDSVRVVLNPRGTASFGGDTLLVLVEGYRFPGPARVPFEVRGADDSVLVRDTLVFRGGRELEARTLRLIPDSLGLGEARLVAGTGEQARRTTALVSFSSSYVLTNFDEMLSLLRYFGDADKLNAMRRAPPRDRVRLWRQFTIETDPVPATPENEALNQYFARVAIANSRYRDEGLPGWRTDRGEAFIRLGDPDQEFLSQPTNRGRVLQWAYNNLPSGRLTLYFTDDLGFGRFRLLPASRTDLERVAQILRGQR